MKVEMGQEGQRVTRLAPSPTGALHLGNARTFLVNWALARGLGWRIYLRIEDLDTPRVKTGAAAGIARTLEWLGMEWDEWEAKSETDRRSVGEEEGMEGGRGVLVQSRDLTVYAEAMEQLAEMGMAYPCELTRAQIEEAGSAPQEGVHETPFPARLRPEGAGRGQEFVWGAVAGTVGVRNWRFVTRDECVEVEDRVAGRVRIDPARTAGDFVLWTKRDQPAYQLAVVVDDHRQGVTDVVRGDDLLDSAGRQLMLYRALGRRPEPRYWHLPLVVGEDGRRLAKRHGDTRLESYRTAGVPSEAIVGLVAYWSGVRDEGQAEPKQMTAREFMERLDVDKIPRDRIVFRTEDHQWLMRQA